MLRQQSKRRSRSVRSIIADEGDDIVDDIMDEIRERAKGSIRRQLMQRLGIYRHRKSLENSTYLLDEEVTEDSQEHLFKVIIVGDATVGKTSFVQRYVQDTFRRDYKGTVGVDFALKVLKWSDIDSIKLQLWDIAGQERFTWMTRVYYKEAHGCIIMFDLTNKHSFDNCLKWKKDVDSKCCTPGGRPIPCILLANKCDLGYREVDQTHIEGLYQEQKFIGWTETSVKENLMVADSVRFLVDVMMQDKSKGAKRIPRPSIQLNKKESLSVRKGCKC